MLGKTAGAPQPLAELFLGKLHFLERAGAVVELDGRSAPLPEAFFRGGDGDEDGLVRLTLREESPLLICEDPNDGEQHPVERA